MDATDAVELTRALVALDTVNPALVPGAPGEGAAAELLATRLDRRGFEVEIVGMPERPSLLARHPGRAGGPSLALNGHLDTVGVAGMHEPFAARVEGDRLYGRGACDMKAGVAAMVVAAERAAEAGHDGDIVLALVADEEHGNLGSAAVLEHLAGRRPDACIVGEPTWLDVVVAHRGFAAIEVELRGRAAHSSQLGNGVNAVTMLGRLLAAVEARDAELAAREPHPYAGHGSMMATVVRGGAAPFTLAVSASAIVERRTVPGERADAGLREVEAMLEELGLDGVCREVVARGPWQLSETPAATRRVELLPFAGRTGAQYWMESEMWEAAGVPTVICGPAAVGCMPSERATCPGACESPDRAAFELSAGFGSECAAGVCWLDSTSAITRCRSGRRTGCDVSPSAVLGNGAAVGVEDGDDHSDLEPVRVGVGPGDREHAERGVGVGHVARAGEAVDGCRFRGRRGNAGAGAACCEC